MKTIFSSILLLSVLSSCLYSSDEEDDCVKEEKPAWEEFEEKTDGDHKIYMMETDHSHSSRRRRKNSKNRQTIYEKTWNLSKEKDENEKLNDLEATF